MESRDSFRGYRLEVNGSPLTWKSKSQLSVTLSTLESDWTAMVSEIRHDLSLQGVLLSSDSGKKWGCSGSVIISMPLSPHPKLD